MVQALTEKDNYLADFAWFEKNRAVQGPSWVQKIRQAAISRFAELGFPTTRDEEWKYTSVDPIAQVGFRLAKYGLDGITTKALAPVTLGESASVQLVFVNGRYSRELSSLRSLPEGVKVESLATALKTDPAWMEPHLTRYASYQDHAFAALNTAFMEDGAFVYLPKGKVVEKPIHLLFVSILYGESAILHPRNLIIAGSNSQATIIESYIGLENSVYFTNAVTELIAGENAVIDHYKLELESEEAFHIATLQGHLDRSSNFLSYSIALGGALVRNDVNAVLAGEGVECALNGLSLVSGRQHVDNHTRIDHVKPHGSSRELYKSILDGRSTGVFNGKIYVHKLAQKTDARQMNKNLLLSEDAVIDTKPQLEIYADDVKCTHGSTIGQLDQDSLFYLRSRGIDPEAARSLLTYAFANEIISYMKVELIRARLENLLVTKLQKAL